eukprot:CAMPEP_0119130010 /NCGR_PEP_ID=MMETSP1310-20130426/7520_1 /TAXON_ID=464262 /ORGANISM="Genus nov. species nov., Strain RCC2339" /LENGTH=374 /DNA_ID=CAMNT_0007120475 /DNA_START=12 /DNA_END=1133 /DNA_ORIENTATION=-
MAENEAYYYVARPAGDVSSEHYEYRTGPVPELGEGEALIEALYLSVDPYMRIQQSAKRTWEEPHALGKVQGSGCVGRVVKSRTGELGEGDVVASYTGWTRFAVVTPGACKVVRRAAAADDGLPLSLYLGVLGMPGRTAYFGLLGDETDDRRRPRAGETVVVSGAAGAVGSLVIQIAKIQGCKTVGIAGKPHKLAWLKDELGVDEVINYKEHDTEEKMTQALRQASPDGYDVYFDNTGGYISDAIIPLLNLRGRMIVCGQISQYGGGLDAPAMGPRFLHHVLYHRLLIQGAFTSFFRIPGGLSGVRGSRRWPGDPPRGARAEPRAHQGGAHAGILARDFAHRQDEMVAQMSQWIKEGKLKYKETVVDGFKSLPDA